MRRFMALLTALIVACGAALAQEDMTAQGVTVMRNHVEEVTDRQRIVVDYPTFACEDAQLELFLTDHITAPILALQRRGQMASDDAYAGGGMDEIRGGFNVSLDLPGLLSVEATVRNRPVDAEDTDTEFFYLIVDLANQRGVTIDELFTDSADEVEEAIQKAVFDRVDGRQVLAEEIAGSQDIPMPEAYFLAAPALRLLYGAGQLSGEAVIVDIPWEELALTPSALLSGKPADPAQDEAEAGGADGPAAGFAAAETHTPDGSQVHNAQSDALLPADTPTPPSPQTEPTLDPAFSLSPVVTPTPMPLAGNDAIAVDVLTHGLWKPLGTEGETYYQFTADGKLLTVTVNDYTVTDGVLVSDALSGTLDIGSDSAFTLHGGDGAVSGYVLNRQGERVAPEEFVTPSPTPLPTPTPTPTPAPTPTPSPSPTPAPTPTLSPYEQAVLQAPQLAALGDASFEKARTLKVYGAPGEETYRARSAQVTTDDSVLIYGVENGWVLVSYSIGNGSRGRMGYIEDTTLADAENVARLSFCALPLTLAADAEATDDPLNAKGSLTTLKAGEQVTLLAFMGEEWAYVQTSLEGRVCRLFIPRTALMDR